MLLFYQVAIKLSLTTCWQIELQDDNKSVELNNFCSKLSTSRCVLYLIKHSCTTHAKFSHLVASLPTSRQQVVFALLVTNCQQVWNKLLTTCNKLDGIIRLVRCKVVPTSPIQWWYNNIVTTLCGEPCNILVISCYKLITACSILVENLEQAVRTQLVDGFWADFLQDVEDDDV
jgi:hypothetical protein